MMLKQTLFISTVTALLLVGCGSDSTSTNTEPIVSSGTEITVERGPVHGSLVLDSNGQNAAFVGNGKYRFANQPSYPITADGGYIDINRNTKIDAGEVRLQYTLQAQRGSVITMVSTIASNPEIKAMLIEEYGLSEDNIANLTPGTNMAIAGLSDEIYAYCLDNNLTPLNLSLTQADQIRSQIHDRIDRYKNGTQSVAELERILMDELGIEELVETDLPTINQAIESTKYQDGTLINDIPAGELTDVQKEGLIFMLEEEKVARDVYEHLYNTWGLRVFTNIAKAEQKHMNTIQLLANKYVLQIPAGLETRGVFINSDLQALYDQLIAKGNTSLVDALEVGVTVEEVDIADLEEIIEAGVPEDLKTAYENLLNGSYKHLDAFNNQLASY